MTGQKHMIEMSTKEIKHLKECLEMLSSKLEMSQTGGGAYKQKGGMKKQEGGKGMHGDHKQKGKGMHEHDEPKQYGGSCGGAQHDKMM